MKTFLSKFLLPFVTFALMVSIVAAPLAAQINVHPAIVTLGLVGGAFAFHVLTSSPNSGIQLQGVEVEMWANYIIERFWKQNAFLQRAFSDDDKVLGGKIVHIPQPGSKPQVMKNRQSFPAAAIRRTDTDLVYTLDEYTTDPTHIADAEKVELSYDKINSVYGDHAGVIAEDAAGDLIVKWLTDLPQTSFIKTTGDATTDILEGATGSRKKTVHSDLRKWQRKFDKANVPEEGRQAMFSAAMMDEFLESLSNTQYRDFSQYVNAKEGVIGRLYGFDILKRSEVAVGYDTGGGVLGIRPYGSAIESGDFDVSMVWQKDAVARALGEVKFFENPDRAEYFGDVYSALLRCGGRRRRADNLGIGVIIQDTAA